MKRIRIGSGAGYGGDRIEPAIDLIDRGNLDYIIFECLAERTISIAQKRKQKDPTHGYNELLSYRFERILDALKNQQDAGKKTTKIITNMGAANPKSAAEQVKLLAKEKNISGLIIAYVEGDDIFQQLEQYKDYKVLETGKKLDSIEGKILSANGYIGIEGIIEALKADATIIITGRCADPSLALAPLVYEFHWKLDNYELLGKGTWIGHLLECAGQLSGGYFADPGIKDVSNLWNLGFPIIEVDENGNGLVTKLLDTGGLVSEQTVKEQTLYEIQDPSQYYTPDVIADFSNVFIKQIEDNCVYIEGASGKLPTGLLKTSIGYHDCYIGTGEISYGGSTAYNRAKLAKEILEKRFALIGLLVEEIRYDYMGVNSLYQDYISDIISGKEDVRTEVRLRVAARTKTKEQAILVGNEVEALYTNGPFGGGGVTKSVQDIVSIASVFIPKEHFHVTTSIL